MASTFFSYEQGNPSFSGYKIAELNHKIQMLKNRIEEMQQQFLKTVEKIGDNMNKINRLTQRKSRIIDDPKTVRACERTISTYEQANTILNNSIIQKDPLRTIDRDMETLKETIRSRDSLENTLLTARQNFTMNTTMGLQKTIAVSA